MGRELKRVYVTQKLFDEVFDWAYNKWKKEGTTTRNNKRLYQNFPESIERYVEEIKVGCGKNKAQKNGDKWKCEKCNEKGKKYFEKYYERRKTK